MYETVTKIQIVLFLNSKVSPLLGAYRESYNKQQAK